MTTKRERELEERLAKYEPPKEDTLMSKIEELEEETNEKIKALIEKCEKETGRDLRQSMRPRRKFSPRGKPSKMPTANIGCVLRDMGKYAARSNEFNNAHDFRMWARRKLTEGFEGY
jgi:hypothetical protein